MVNILAANHAARISVNTYALSGPTDAPKNHLPYHITRAIRSTE